MIDTWNFDEFSVAEHHQCSLKEEGDEEEDDPTSEVEEGEGGEDGQDDEFEDAWENYVLVGLLLWVLLDVLMFLILKCASLVSWFSSLHMHTHILLEEVQVGLTPIDPFFTVGDSIYSGFIWWNTALDLKKYVS